MFTCAMMAAGANEAIELALTRAAVPLNLLLLGVLRMLGRGTCTDGITELSEISETKMNSFLKDFCACVSLISVLFLKCRKTACS